METWRAIEDRRREPGEFHLAWAMGVSVLLHAIVVALTLWQPLVRRPETAPAEQNRVLQFTFAQPTAPPAERPQPARGDVPFPTPPTPRERVPEPAREAPQGETAIAVPPQQPAPQAQPQQPRPQPERQEAEARDERREGVDEPARQPGTRLPDASDADLKPGDEADPSRAAPETERPFDMAQALGSFQRAIDQSRAERPPQQPGAGPQRNVFTPADVGPMPVQGAPYGILEFTSRDYDWSEYASQIYWEILRAWYNRLYVTSPDFEKWAFTNRTWQLDHRSGIRFVIERNGNVTGIELRVPAGCPPLDASALDALSEVILPPLPADFPRDREEVRATFIAQGDIRFMRTTLGQLKAAGYF